VSDDISIFTRRLESLLQTHGSPVELRSVRNEDGTDDICVLANCLTDPVLRPPPEAELAEGVTGPWNRRGVRLVVRIPTGGDSPVSAELTFATRDADEAGDRSVTFGWEFGEAGFAGLAEMRLNDSRTFKLDYFSVLPPSYVSEFVVHCLAAFTDACGDE